jgi:ribonucleoside-diphosphate reductase alpha chain
MLAWKTNCKGITVFRDGCKDAQVLNLGVKDRKEKDLKDTTLERPFVVYGSTYKLNTPVGNAFVTINVDKDGDPLELFVNVGKAGSDVTAMAEAIGRTISTSLRFRSQLSAKERAKEIAMQLAGIGGRRSVGFGKNKILSLPDAIAYALSNHFNFRVNGFVPEQNGEFIVNGSGNGLTETNGSSTNGHSNGIVKEADDISAHINLSDPIVEETGEAQVLTTHKVAGDICPSCGASSLVYQEGCTKCFSCGYSEC